MNANTFSALADSNRFQIVEILKSGPLTVGEISERLWMLKPISDSTACGRSLFERWMIG